MYSLSNNGNLQDIIRQLKDHTFFFSIYQHLVRFVIVCETVTHLLSAASFELIIFFVVFTYLTVYLSSMDICGLGYHCIYYTLCLYFRLRITVKHNETKNPARESTLKSTFRKILFVMLDFFSEMFIFRFKIFHKRTTYNSLPGEIWNTYLPFLLSRKTILLNRNI